MIKFAIGVLFPLLAAMPCLAQSFFDLAVFGGAARSQGLTVTAPTGSADATMKFGFVAGAALTDHAFEHLSGEVRYTYRRGNLRLSSGGSEVGFEAMAHSVHYAFLVFPNGRSSRLRPFLSAGGGGRWYEGTGAETPFQPLSRFAILTRTREFQPLLTAGAGVFARFSSRVSLRVEFHDFMTPAPGKVIAPMGGAQLRGWFHDLTPMVGLNFALSPR